ncbi:MAG: hypothetical protein ACFCD0_20280 [Gemmataceae bacterium]
MAKKSSANTKTKKTSSSTSKIGLHPKEKTKASVIEKAIDEGKGILRLAPTWVPRSFLMPGRRLKLHPDDLYKFGAHRGGIDERWFSSTTRAENGPETLWDEGLSYVVVGGKKKFTLREAIAAEEQGERLLGPIFENYGRWPVYSKFFDNMGPIPHHMHQSNEQAKLVNNQEGKPESYYFPPQLNKTLNNFPYTFFGLEPGTTKEEIKECLARWDEGDNGILDYSKAYRLKPGTGWLVPPCVLHAPGSLVTFEPQWGSDVFAMYQSMVEGRYVPKELLLKDFPKGKHKDLDHLIEALDWEKNVNPNFKDSHYLEPIVHHEEENCYVDHWIVYGTIEGDQLFSAKELTIYPDQEITIEDNGAHGLIAVQGSGLIGDHPIQTPAMLRFEDLPEDEYFVSHEAATAGVTYKNTGSEDLVILRYFGPGANPDAPEVGDYKK